MRRRLALVALLSALTAVFVVAGISIADGALHPARRPLTASDEEQARQMAASRDVDFADEQINAPDGAILRAWLVKPKTTNHEIVLVLHGLGDNREGMVGYAEIFLSQGYAVLMPDARAHGVSGGSVATYGLLERGDIRSWLDWIDHDVHPRCIFGFGESMGAAQLLQALEVDNRFCAVAVESPFANFQEIAFDRMGQAFHVGPWLGRTILRPVVAVAFWRARSKYGYDMKEISPERAVDRTPTPILLIHGAIDSNIPPRHSLLIYAHVHNNNVQLWLVPGADHCGAISLAPDEFRARVLAWFAGHSRPSTQAS